MKASLLCLACAGLLNQTAPAVVVFTGLSNTTAPPGQPFFGNVGSVNGASAIYLGEQWVITAAHVAGGLPGSVTFGGTAYSTAAGSFHHLTNPVGLGLSVFTDLVAFRLATDPGLPTLGIAAAPTTAGTPVMLVGYGGHGAASPTFWQVTFNPGPADDVWTELAYPDPGINAAGFKIIGSGVKQWGINQIETIGELVNYGAGDVVGFTTEFGNGPTNDEAQAASGDSGGAVFRQVAGSWQLAGMMAAVGTYEKQPSAAVIGNLTYSLDLAFYRSQLIAIIPEPSAALGTAWVLGLVLLRRRRSIPAWS